MAQTANYNLEKPDTSRDVDEEFYQLQETLDLLDAILAALQTAVNTKSAVGHTHAISDVINLASELAAKMPASTTFKLDDLTDVSGADGAPDNYVLVKSALGWIPSSALAALGTHGHLISEITGLVAALAGKSDVGHAHAIADTTGLQTALDGKQPLDGMLTALAGLASANGKFLAFTGADTPVVRDIVGTVSQSAGVPTAAIIESGSNANGSFTKWADGTMICTKSYNAGTVTFSASGQIFISSAVNPGAYAAAFVAAPTVPAPSIISSSGLVWPTTAVAAGSTNFPQFFLMSSTSSSSSGTTLVLEAVGRWF